MFIDSVCVEIVLAFQEKKKWNQYTVITGHFIFFFCVIKTFI